jgi:hypothetical protein
LPCSDYETNERRRLQGRRRRTRRFTPGLETLEDRRMLASIIWDGGGSDHHWNNPANWFDQTNEVDGVLPTSDDDVVIRDQFAGITVLVDDDVTVNSLQSAAGLNINGNVDFALEAASQIDGPVQLAGRLGGSGTVTFTDSLTWTGGNMGGDGTTVIAAGATLTVDGSVNISDGVSATTPLRTIDNFGTIEWLSGNISTSDRLTLRNRPGALIDIQSNALLGHNAGLSGRVLINEGTLRKSGGSGTSEFRVRLENTGTVDVQSGTLALGRGGFSTGHLSFEAGTTLEFKHNSAFTGAYSLFTLSLDDGGSLVGQGRMLVAAGDGVFIEGDGLMDVAQVEIINPGKLYLNRDVSIPEVLISGGRLLGTGTLTVVESMQWTGGDMGGDGTTVIPAGATLTVDGSVNISDGVSGRTPCGSLVAVIFRRSPRRHVCVTGRRRVHRRGTG